VAAIAPDVHLTSEIPATHPEKAAVETAVLRMLAGVPGPWSVRILDRRAAKAWLVVAKQPGRPTLRIAIPEDQQSGESVRARLKEVLRGR
jgi:hypothetical protein